MNKTDRELYLGAMVEHARRLSVRATMPVIVHVYVFFTEACKRKKIPHAFRPGDTRRIVSLFFNDLQNCLQLCDGGPIYLAQTTRNVVLKVGQKKEARFTPELTAKTYASLATVSKQNPQVALAIFGPKADKRHPILDIYKTTQKRITTSVENYTRNTQFIEREGIALELSKMKPHQAAMRQERD